ncbi:MAG TPA: SAM-dependent methyltransferase [Mycobacteriales bacterium]|nr:SAM-dependent methyltransferase [Mycobacteriales bacterium]
MGTLLDGVSRTAVGVARVRARESTREDRLFDDPYAEAFAALGEPVDTTAPPSPARLAIAFQIIMRTRFYDDWLLAQAAQGCRQFVVLGAGLDTRAFRLAWPAATTVFELDLPPVLEVKREVLGAARPTCERITVPADLTTDWGASLEAAGFDPAHPTAWLAEGLLVYLDEAQATHILSTVTQLSAGGSSFATEALSGDSDRLAAPDMVATTSMWQGGLGAAMPDWLTAHGWQPQIDSLGDVARRYGRPPSREPRGGFITAVRP